MPSPVNEPRTIAENAARDSYGRLLAYLASRTRDLATAQDALADAFLNALESWPVQGVPDRPEAWLLTTARRRLIDGHRRDQKQASTLEARKLAALEAPEMSADGHLPDDRLKLLFACAHPSIDATVRTPLLLQAVFGFDATRIASSFLVAPSTMSQRLVRAKTKIRDAGIRFEVPDPEDLPERLGAVLDAVYAAFGNGWDDVDGGDPRRRGLVAEAIWLGRLIHSMLGDEPETGGLLALMLFCDSRRSARRDVSGNYVPLSRQDSSAWDWGQIADAESILTRASRFQRFGRYQLEAAIQSAHSHRAVSGQTNWEAVAVLYDGLVGVSPTIGALVGRAAAIAEARGIDQGLAALRQIPEPTASGYQPYWALASHLHQVAGNEEEARLALERAIGLSEDHAVRRFLIDRGGSSPPTK